MDSKMNQADSGKSDDAAPAKVSLEVEPSMPMMAPKCCVSSSVVLNRQESTTESTASIKTDPGSEAQLKSSSQVPNSNSECSPDKEVTESTTAHLKRDFTVHFAPKDTEDQDHILNKENSAQVQTRPVERTFSSVVKVPPGAPPPVRLEPGAQLTIRQPFKIMMDIWGVLTSYSFRPQLFAFIDEHLKPYLVAHFDEADTRDYVNELAKRTADDRALWPTMPLVPTVAEFEPGQTTCQQEKEDTAEAVVRNLAFRKDTKDKALMKRLDAIYSQIWNEGYRLKTLRPHLFSDVMANFQKWHAEPFFIKLYTFASGPPEIQKLFLSATAEGDVSEYLTYCFDTRHSFKYDSNRYRQVVSGLSERDPRNLFYLTDSPKKGREARKAGLTVFIIRREGNKQYKQEDLDKFTVLDSFDQFDFFEFQ